MKKSLIGAVILTAAVAISACGVAGNTAGTSSQTATAPSPATKAKAVEAYLAFTSETPEAITITVDGKQYRKETVQVKTSGSMKEFQEMAGNIIVLTPGTHQVSVQDKNGKQVYRNSISVSAQEYKVVQL